MRDTNQNDQITLQNWTNFIEGIIKLKHKTWLLHKDTKTNPTRWHLMQWMKCCTVWRVRRTAMIGIPFKNKSHSFCLLALRISILLHRASNVYHRTILWFVTQLLISNWKSCTLDNNLWYQNWRKPITWLIYLDP